MGVLFCIEMTAVAAALFFAWLEQYQTAIHAVREAWDALPDDLFGDELTAKAVFHDAACNEGLFRILAVNYANESSISAFRVEALKNTSITNLRNYRDVLHRWCSSIRGAAGTDAQVIGSVHDNYEESTETPQHPIAMNTPTGKEPLVTVT